MVQPAQRDGELIADSAPERRALRKPQMMRVRRPPTAQQARLQCHEFEVVAIAVAPRFAQGEVSFLDHCRSGVFRGGFRAVGYGKRHRPVERPSAGVEYLRPSALAELTLAADPRR